MSADGGKKLIVVGSLKGAHGVRGEVRVKSFTAEPDDLFAYGALTDAEGRTVLTPKSARPGKDHFIVRPKEQKQKEEWDALRGTLLHVARERLPDADEDEFYIEDLVGLDVYAGGEARIGRVKSVEDYGAGDLVDIRLDSGGSVLVPFTQADVPVVDIAAGRIVVATLEDWLSTGDEARPPEENQG